ncbi:MAG: fasciclin domain-containing protein [Acidobacteria bacterium]|nr:fasciclin domain-containing protein [Acidobacteriota bacterium]
MTRFTITATCAMLLSVAAVARCQDEKPTIVQLAAQAGQFQTLLTAAKAAGLADTLATGGPFTVFAPTDEAFGKLGKDAIADLLKPENKAKLAAILKFHVVDGTLLAADVLAREHVPTLLGQSLAVGKAHGTATIGGARIAKTDLAAKNGVVHVIDAVLMPDLRPNLVETANAAGSFATLLAAAKAAGLADTLATGGPFTVFAPTDAAFGKLGKDTIAELLKPENKAKLTAILKLHVVAGTVPAAEAVKLHEAKTIGGETLKLAFDGKTLLVGGAAVVKTDIAAKGGIIHVIDAVILPPND